MARPKKTVIKKEPKKAVEVVENVEIQMVDGTKLQATIRKNGLADYGTGLAFQREDGLWVSQE